MDDTGTETVQGEEQLKTTLHGADKEKLRRKLLYLQREYHRTAQRLQRAERSEAVQRHVSSRSAQQHNHNLGEQRGTAHPHDPSVLISTTTYANGVHQCHGHTTDSEKPRSQVDRFIPSLDATCPQTPLSTHESFTGHRPSSSLRLRSRRSRLRLEKQSSVVGVCTDSSQDGQEQNEKMEPALTQQTTKGDIIKPTDIVNEGEELISGADSESPSLLLTHSSVFLQNEARDIEEQALDRLERRDKEIKVNVASPKETQSFLLTCQSELHTDETERAETQSESKKAGLEQREDGQMERLLQGNNKKVDTIVEDVKQCEKGDKNTVKEDKISMDGGECDKKGVGLLDSCTLVEGLLFPAEYYVRTTRRMASSHSQPDIQAVILSQLNMGRHRRSRANGRRLTPNRGSNNQTSDSVEPCTKSQEAELSAEIDSQGSSKNSDQTPAGQNRTEACFSAAVSAPRPARGRKTSRGRRRDRRRPYTPQCSFSPDTRPLGPVHTSDHPQLTSSPFLPSPLLHETTVSPSPSLCAAAEPKPLLTGPVPDDKQHVSTSSIAAEYVVSGGTGTKDSPASGHPLYPIFLKGNSKSNRSSQLSGSQGSSQSLLVPSAPAPASLALPSLSLSSFVKSLDKFDIPQDFHLPDDQFASLKLHKLRQVAMETGVEPFSPPSYCTRGSVHRYVLSQSSSDTPSPLPVPLGSTPTVSSSPNTTEVKHTSTPSVEEQNTLTAADTTELSDQEKTEGPRTESQGHAASTESMSADRVVDECKEDEAELSHPGKLHPGKIHGCAHSIDDGALPQTPSFSCVLETAMEEPPDSSPVSHTDAGSGESPAKETKKCSEPDTSPGGDRNGRKSSVHHSIQSQLLLSPPSSTLLTTPQLPSSPMVPLLGVTPQSALAALPLTSSPAAPTLVLPPPHSPSTQALPPPPLSPCPSRPPSQPLTSTASQLKASCQLVCTAEPANGARASNICPEGSEEKTGLETAEEDLKSCTHTLTSPSGGCLVDACCLPGSSGRLCVAAAGKWAVCLWTQTSASDWSLLHTWSFNEMVINVFPVLDADGLICVTLGQLEIREVRILSCTALSQVSLCGGLVQTVVGVSKSRVVTSSHSATGSALVVYTLSDSGSALSSQPLVSPGVCVGALSPVHGLPDALIGTDESEGLFIWNLDTGQLLRKVLLGEGFSHTACLRGYSYSGVLFVLLQHQFLSSHEEGGGEEVPVKEKRTMGLLSLVAVNPLSGKSILASCLRPPSAWSGRLCEADANDCSVVGLSQNGCVCVWELGHRGPARVVRAPESEGWQLARWGGGGNTLLTGHHNGDVTLHFCSKSLL